MLALRFELSFNRDLWLINIYSDMGHLNWENKLFETLQDRYFKWCKI